MSMLTPTRFIFKVEDEFSKSEADGVYFLHYHVGLWARHGSFSYIDTAAEMLMNKGTSYHVENTSLGIAFLSSTFSSCSKLLKRQQFFNFFRGVLLTKHNPRQVNQILAEFVCNT